MPETSAMRIHARHTNIDFLFYKIAGHLNIGVNHAVKYLRAVAEGCDHCHENMCGLHLMALP